MSNDAMMQEKSQHTVKLDTNTCRIECGCGCHKTIDGLPHLLSPHINPAIVHLNPVSFLPAQYHYMAVLHLYFPDIVLPPPIFN
ncbi:MAG: hypothetical protein Q9M22_06930 [Mariprofundaceae bacterium]|nr:hypothetical protein [Mariprofundaceae bacterium]